ncbi:MAG: hypothetical protein E7311_06990 [Clostridiales bacterium]|nr:hypothetical protein [Clostridiales bacterium]
MEKIINNNIRNTSIVILINILIVGVLVFGISLIFEPLFNSIVIGIIFSIMINLLLIISSNYILLKLNGITKISNTELNKIDKMVTEIAKKLDINKPNICLLPDNNINSISIGRGVNKSFLCISKGALDLLTNNELEYICTFEMLKILKRATSFNTISTVTLGFIPILSDKFFRTVFKGIQKKGKESESLMRLLVTTFFLIFAPIFNKIIFALSQKNINSITDNDVFYITNSTNYAISTLNKSLENNKLNIMYSRACANMFFVNPLIGQKVSKKFCFTETIESRIEKLKKL